MRKGCFLLFLLFPFVAQAQDMARVRANLKALCAPEMHGRGYAENGHKIAAGFIQNQFQEAGLKPFGRDHYQYFVFPVNVVQQAKLTLNGQKLRIGHDFIPDAGIATSKARLKLQELDTLIFSDEQRDKAFLNQNLQKRALVVSEKFWTKRSILPDAFAQKMQTAGALLVTHPNNLTYTVATSQHPQPQFDLLQSAVPSRPKKARYKTKSTFFPAFETQNVIGYIPGKVQPDSFLVFTAHYDHLGRIDENTYFPGAHDNASGTSLLLELAHHFSKPENQPDYSIAFMAFGAEEAGLVGSRYYVENPLFPLRQIKFLVNLDLAGTGEGGLMVVNGKIHKTEFARLKKLNDEKQYFPELKSRGKAANSDHYPFSEKGVPAFFFYTLGGVTYYHQVYDQPVLLPLTNFPELFNLILDFTQLLSPKR
jgi:aminopeptidase YwaD